MTRGRVDHYSPPPLDMGEEFNVIDKRIKSIHGSLTNVLDLAKRIEKDQMSGEETTRTIANIEMILKKERDAAEK